MRGTVFFHDFNCPDYNSFDDYMSGPTPVIGSVVTLCDFSEEFYVDAVVQDIRMREPFLNPEEQKKTGRKKGPAEPYYVLEPNMDTIVYDDDDEYEKPPDFYCRTEAGKRTLERYPNIREW